MIQASPEQYPPAPQELRAQLFYDIGLLATHGDPFLTLPDYIGLTIDPFPEELVPEFVEERLPLAELPVHFTMTALAKLASHHVVRSILRIRRNMAHADLTNQTSWRIDWTFGPKGASYPAQRIVSGTEQRLPKAPGGQIHGIEELMSAFIRRQQAIRRAVPTIETCRKPWPAAFVEPEGEQLISVLAGLLRERGENVD